MKKFLQLSFMLMFAFTFSESWAQERTVSGKVTSIEDGSSLPGVNVVLKGTTAGTVTDIDGNFSLSVPSDGSTLVFSFIGLATEEISIGSRSVVDVQMSPDVKQLSEIVVTGQGLGTEKKRLSTTVETITAKQLESVPNLRIDQVLQSQLPSSQIKMSSGQPGTSSVIRTRGVVSANGATTPVIYIDGVRVDNRSLGNGNAVGTNATGGASSSALSDLPIESIERIEVIKGGAAATLYGSDAANGVIQIFTKKGTSGKATFNFETQQGIMKGTEDYLKYDKTADFLFEPGHIQSYRMGVNGGTDKITYDFSGGVYRDEGFRLGNEDTRYNLRTGLSAELNEKMKYSGTFSVNSQVYTRDLNANFGGPFGDLESNLLGVLDDLSEDELQAVEQQVVNRVETFNNKITTRRFQTSQSLTYTPTQEITIFGNVGVDSRFSRDKLIVTNAYDIASGGTGVGAGQINVGERNFFSITGAINGQYQKSFGDFSLVGLVGFQFFNDRDERVTYIGNDVVEGSLSINNSAEQNAEDLLLSVANYGYYANANIGFRDKVFLEAGVRVDQNSAFGDLVDPQIFPKVGIAYSLTEEGFMDNFSNVITQIKIRANYGEAGNFPTPFANNTTFTSVPYLGSNAYTQGAAGDPNLTVERSKTIELGTDLSFIEGRINFDFTYYNTNTEDAIFNAPFSSSFGIANQQRNLGKIENEGIELAGVFDIIRSEKFDMTLNASWNTNTNIVADNGGVAPFNLYGFAFLGVFVDQEEPVGFLRGSAASLDENGGVVVETNQSLGQVTPKGFGSFGLNLTYNRRWNFTMTGDYQYGSDIVNVNEVLSYGFTNAGSNLVAPEFEGQPFFNIANLFVQSGDYVKIRNISVSYDLPVKQIFGGNVFNGASITLSATNPFNFVPESNGVRIDPEVSGATPGNVNGFSGVDLGGYNYATESAPRIYMASLRLKF
uniref:TonB-dependent receptor domain-containing protein n=1 Tax=Fulvivirga sp. TaxID=1931237 RepID=UPI0040491F6D